MFLLKEVLIHMAVFSLGAIGFLVAWHIYKEKKAKRALVCLVRFDCDTVVHSDYSRFLGIRVEILGMIYYSFITIVYFIFTLNAENALNALVGFMAMITVIGFIFSIYLIGVQIFILKKGCSWCFVSAFICILIFTLIIVSYDFSYLVSFL